MKKFSLILLTTFAHAAFAMEETSAVNVWNVQNQTQKTSIEVFSEQEKIMNQIKESLESTEGSKVAFGLQQCIKLTTIHDKEKALFRRLKHFVKDEARVSLLSNNVSAIYDAIKAVDTQAGKDYYVIPAVDTAVKSNNELLKKYNADIESQTSNLTAKNKRAQELEAQKADYEKQINELATRIREYRNELSSKEISSKIASTSAEITTLSQKLSPLETRLQDVTTALEKTKVEIQDLDTAIQNAKEKTTSLESTNNDLLTIRKPIYMDLFKTAKETALAERDSLIDQITHLKNKPDITGEQKIANETEIKRLEAELAKKQEKADKYLHYDAKLSGSYGVTDAIPYIAGKAAKKLASTVVSFVTWGGSKTNKTSPNTK